MQAYAYNREKIVIDPVVRRIIDALEDRKISQKELISYLGLPYSTFTGWKYDGIKSYMKYIDQIASFLDVPEDYLLHGGIDHYQKTSLLPSEIETYKKLRGLNDQRSAITNLIDVMFNTNQRIHD